MSALVDHSRESSSWHNDKLKVCQCVRAYINQPGHYTNNQFDVHALMHVLHVSTYTKSSPPTPINIRNILICPHTLTCASTLVAAPTEHGHKQNCHQRMYLWSTFLGQILAKPLGAAPKKNTQDAFSQLSALIMSLFVSQCARTARNVKHGVITRLFVWPCPGWSGSSECR